MHVIEAYDGLIKLLKYRIVNFLEPLSQLRISIRLLVGQKLSASLCEGSIDVIV